jgi:hypothetical protein
MDAFNKGISSLSSDNSVEQERDGKDRMKVEGYERQN